MVFAHEVFVWLLYLIKYISCRRIISIKKSEMYLLKISLLARFLHLSASQLCPWSLIVSLFVEKSSGKVVMDVCGARVEEG